MAPEGHQNAGILLFLLLSDSIPDFLKHRGFPFTYSLEYNFKLLTEIFNSARSSLENFNPGACTRARASRGTTVLSRGNFS